MPTRSAIWVWVRDSKNLSASTVRSCSGRAASKGRKASRFSIWSEAQVDVTEGVDDRRGVLITAPAAVDRQRVVGAAGDQTLDHFVAIHAEFGGQLRCGGRSAQPLGQLSGGSAQPQVQFLSRRGTFNRPAVVAEVPAQSRP